MYFLVLQGVLKIYIVYIVTFYKKYIPVKTTPATTLVIPKYLKRLTYDITRLLRLM